MRREYLTCLIALAAGSAFLVLLVIFGLELWQSLAARFPA
jgi:hypothetical protein